MISLILTKSIRLCYKSYVFLPYLPLFKIGGNTGGTRGKFTRGEHLRGNRAVNPLTACISDFEFFSNIL